MAKQFVGRFCEAKRKKGRLKNPPAPSERIAEDADLDFQAFKGSLLQSTSWRPQVGQLLPWNLLQQFTTAAVSESAVSAACTGAWYAPGTEAGKQGEIRVMKIFPARTLWWK